MKHIKLILLTAIMAFVPSGLHAQSMCDKLYAEGVKLQKTQTVSAQRSAITKFEKAKACYDSDAKKNQCDQQIKVCRYTIKKLSSPKASTTAKPTEKPTDSINSITPIVAEKEIQKRNVTLSVSPTQLTFRGKGEEFKKVKVICNYTDWKVKDSPTWVKYSRSNDGELVIEVPDKNPDTKNVRSGIVTVECEDTNVSIVVVQKRGKLINKIGIF